MKRVTLILGLLLALGVVPTLAQDIIMYEDPAGRFSVPIPTGWTDESTDEVGRFVSPDSTTVSILGIEAVDATSGDEAVLAALAPDLVGTDPVQTAVETFGGGTWTENIYAPAPDRIVAQATQWIDGVTYALLFDIPGQDALVANQGHILSMFNQFSVGERLDLTNVEPQSFTDEMLAELADYIEDARERFHVPGVAIAIVQNGDAVYLDGFGMTEPDSGQPVTSDTLFMIASTTKSMTTMMMGTLVDDGILAWDQPVTDILPSFALSDPTATTQIRVRDLVNMSSGVPRFDIILQVDAFTPQELIASLAEIPLVAAPGEMWNYSNQMVATGGYIAALAAGAPMDGLYEGYVNLVQERVFDPIGMPDTTFDFDAASATPNHALPYIFNIAAQEYLTVPLDYERFTVPTAPAGAVWSTANDMARYLQTQLSGGLSPDGERVITEAALHTTQSPEITPGGLYASYGMGWGIDSYNGQMMVLHGGNVLGFTSDLAFLPDADLGVVVLVNAGNANNFLVSVRQYVFELAFGLEHDASQRLVSGYEAQEAQPQVALSVTAVDPETVAPYLGVYEHGATLEMRDDELWFVGAFGESRLYPAAESGTYTAEGAYSALGVRFVETDGQLSVEFSLPNNPLLTLNKVD